MDIAQVVFDKKARRYTVNLFGQTFVGLYQPSLKTSELLDTLFSAWSITTVQRSDFCLMAIGSKIPIPDGTKISKLVAPKKVPVYFIGCNMNAVISSPNLGGQKPFKWVIPLGKTMDSVATTISSFFGVDITSFLIEVEGTTVNLNDFIRPLTSITLGEFLATSSNSLKLTTSQAINPPLPTIEPVAKEEKPKREKIPKASKGARPSTPPPGIASTYKKQVSSETKSKVGAPPKAKYEKMEEMQSTKRDNQPSPPSLAQAPPAADMPRPELSQLSIKSFPAPPVEKMKANEADLGEKLNLTGAGSGGEAAPSPAPPTKYTMNMGMEYYPVMMEKTSYLFYIHLSQKELKIETSEGKVVYETTFTFVAKKEEPPVLELRVFGEGFEVHPISGKVTVMKDAINPPLIIFSVMPVPLKSMAEEGADGGKKKKQKKKGPDQRHLHVTVTYEGDTVNHTVLGVTVQPKHYQIKLGPITLNVSKPVAMLISVAISVAASYSVIMGVMKTNAAPSVPAALENIAPGAASWVAIAMYFVALAKAIKPLKKTWESAFAAGKLPGMMK